MSLPKFTLRAIRAAQLAGRRAARAGAKKVEPEHLLVALIGHPRIAPILQELKLDAASLIDPAREMAGTRHLGQRTRPRLSGRMEKVLMSAEEEARALGGRGIDVQHLLVALLREGGMAAGFLAGRGATYDVVRRAIRIVWRLSPPSQCPQCGYDLRATPERCPGVRQGGMMRVCDRHFFEGEFSR